MRFSAMATMAVAVVGFGGCAKHSDEIAASYVSPYQYENFTCPQLANEAQRLSVHAAQVAGVQDQKATKTRS